MEVIRLNEIVTVDINTKKAHSFALANCSEYTRFGMTYDPTNLRLFAFGSQNSTVVYLEIDTSTYACSVFPVKLPYGFDFVTYDPTTQIIYIADVLNKQVFFYSFSFFKKIIFKTA
eukprot:Phypoly_transcript_14230.p1 GENE.Phypoly_transcript_14230~~Phypoly_transcript_14230.p1  ORF type:complete len:116 (+),score=12.07 Phypoly_transcript_14230:471-818(+)